MIVNDWPENAVDVVMLANTRNTWFQDLTFNTIKSLRESEPNVRFNVILIEDNIDLRKQASKIAEQNITLQKHIANADAIFYPDPEIEFGYNKYMNIGLEFLNKNSKNDYVVLANNDLVFGTYWFTNIKYAMEQHGLLSACPISPGSNRHNTMDPSSNEVMVGYEIRPHLPGWCIVQKRKELYDIIGPLSEDFAFWFCDNDYGNTLEKHNIKHGLVLKSCVQHLGSPDGPTINSTSPEEKNRITGDHVQDAYFKKWKLGPYKDISDTEGAGE